MTNSDDWADFAPVTTSTVKDGQVTEVEVRIRTRTRPETTEERSEAEEMDARHQAIIDAETQEGAARP